MKIAEPSDLQLRLFSTPILYYLSYLRYNYFCEHLEEGQRADLLRATGY